MSQDAPQQFLVNLGFFDGRGALLDANEFNKSGDEIAHRKDKIGNTRRNRAAWHGRVFGFLWVLYQDDAARLLDGACPNRAIRSGPAQDDREAVAHPFGNGPEEQVYWSPLAARLFEFCSGNFMINQLNAAVRRNDVD